MRNNTINRTMNETNETNDDVIQVRVTKEQKRRYMDAAEILGCRFPDWIRRELDKASDILKKIRVAPDQLARHHKLRVPLDEEGERILADEIAQEVADQDALEAALEAEFGTHHPLFECLD